MGETWHLLRLIHDQHAYFEGALNLKDRVDLLQILQSNVQNPLQSNAPNLNQQYSHNKLL
ncbi:hypothetical protein CR513_40822, partial [Mucuna pruriens]